jgi:crotonyl-CoA carboxylase/reductase
MAPPELFELGETPPVGTVPRYMYASVIRRSRYGSPVDAFAAEVVPVPALTPGTVLVWTMAAGINYNNVWSAIGRPLDVIKARLDGGDKDGFHIGGSEGSGIVWAVGEGVTSVRIGDEVVLSGCHWDESAADIRFGADPITSSTQRAWGYETNYGSFAQFALVRDFQCHPKPPNLSWAHAAAFMLTGATALRQLGSWHPNVVRPGDPVLIWGGSGGLGCMGIQITKVLGGTAVAVVSTEAKAKYCYSLGADGVIDRTDFHHWELDPFSDDMDEYHDYLSEMRRFGRRFWELIGRKDNPKIVLEHPGRHTLPTSLYLCDPAGMVVICGATTGWDAPVDLRYLWMRQKRLQGSHFANLRECRQITWLVAQGLVDPCLSTCWQFSEIGLAHQYMLDNKNAPGNAVALVNAQS